MKLVGIQIGKPRTIQWNGKEEFSSIWKTPISGQTIKVTPSGLEGDSISDPKYHGGEFKAVYSYASEHYLFWNSIHSELDFPFGAMGENLSTEGLEESELCIGDTLRIGNCLLQAMEPRFPCYKLGVKFGGTKIIKEFLDSGRLGIYFKVLQPGEISIGDSISIEQRHPNRIKVYDIYKVKTKKTGFEKLIPELLSLSILNPEWQDWLKKRDQDI